MCVINEIHGREENALRENMVDLTKIIVTLSPNHIFGGKMIAVTRT